MGAGHPATPHAGTVVRPTATSHVPPVRLTNTSSPPTSFPRARARARGGGTKPKYKKIKRSHSGEILSVATKSTGKEKRKGLYYARPRHLSRRRGLPPRSLLQSFSLRPTGRHAVYMRPLLARPLLQPRKLASYYHSCPPPTLCSLLLPSLSAPDPFPRAHVVLPDSLRRRTAVPSAGYS
jgi:hypothetical protein